MRPKRISSSLIFFAVILVAFGDLRNIISPVGYWACWGAWLVLAGFSAAWPSKGLWQRQALLNRPISPASALFCTGFLLLTLGFLVVGFKRGDNASFLQALKILSIFVIGILIKFHARLLTEKHVFITASIISFSAIAVLFLSIFIFDGFSVRLGDGRLGLLFLYPGVMWKIGVFFSLYGLAWFLGGNKYPFLGFTCFVVGLILVVLDGSRTGFIWFLFSATTLFLIYFLSVRARRTWRKTARNYLSVSLVLGTILAVSIGSNFLELIIPVGRVLEGDSIRVQMLLDGLSQADRCLPFGCGYAATVTPTSEGEMVVHNAYVGLLGDAGLPALVGYVLIILSPLARRHRWRPRSESMRRETRFFRLTALLAIAGYAVISAFHPYSTEMSEWGLFLLSAAWVLSFERPERRARYWSVETQPAVEEAPVRA